MDPGQRPTFEKIGDFFTSLINDDSGANEYVVAAADTYSVQL
jgi:hypothetical protein